MTTSPGVAPVTPSGYVLSNANQSGGETASIGNPDNARAQISAGPGESESAASVGVRKQRSEFQEFIRASLGRDLPLFGHDLFQQPPSTFAPVDRVPVTADYVLGPGDEIMIRAWGQIDVDYRVTVDRNGMINLPKVGNISLAGIQYKDLRAYLKTAIGRVFKNFDLTVTLGQLRSIQVFVVGQAARPGAYTVSSLSTLINTLFASGGPNPNGSMRRIQLKRGEQVITEFDMYDLLVKGDKSRDVRLLPGDVIYIPPVGGLVAVSGSVNAPAIYEIRDEPTLQEVLALAGGLSTTALSGKVMLERISLQQVRIVEEIGLDQAGLAQTLRGGDLVRVLPLSPRFGNAVTLRGNVELPARYPWKTGMRVRDLISSREMLIPPEYWIQKNATTKMETQGENDLRNDVMRRTAGAVAEAQVEKNLRNDLMRRSNEVNWEYAVIERLDPHDLTTKLIPFHLGRAILDNDPAENIALQPGDVVTIFSKDDIRVPKAKQTAFVRIEGEVVQPGLYQAQPGETLRQLMARIGGFAGQAYLYGSEFTREAVRRAQQQKMDEAINRLEQDFARHATAAAQNVLNPEQAQALAAEREARQTMIEKMRQIRATGRIPLELPADATVADLPDIVLEDGDRLVIPSRPAVVSVIGAVYNPNSFLYRENKRLADYLGQAGGINKHADRDSMYILRADGTVFSRQHASWHSSLENQNMMPGDTVVVPEELDKSTWRKELKDWTQILYQFGLGAAAIAVLR